MKFKAYFQDELNYLKDAGNEFSRLNPRLAKYLSESSADPDMERLFEGFAFLTARLRQTLDDELSDLTQSVLQMLWRGFLAPMPPLAMLKFSPIDRSTTGRHLVDAGMQVSSEASDGIVCEFVTTADCVIYPLELTEMRLERSGNSSSLWLYFSTLSGLPLSNIGLTDLRLWLTGDALSADTLYLWTRCHLKSVRVTGTNGESFVLPPHLLQPGGFTPEEALLPGSVRAFDGYRLLLEYFAFPQKFRCLDLIDLAQFFSRFTSSGFSLEFQYDSPVPPEARLNEGDIRLYCTPIANLCEAVSEPFQILSKETSQLVQAGSQTRGQLDVFSVDLVSTWSEKNKILLTGEDDTFPRYESSNHLIEHAKHRRKVYFREKIVPRQSDLGFDTFLSFVYHDGKPAAPDGRHIGAALTCFSPGAAEKVRAGDISMPTRQAPSFATFVNISAPTRPLYPCIEEGEHWRLISNLSQNVMDLTDPEILKEIVRVYDYPQANDRQAEQLSRKRLNGIAEMATKPVDRLFSGRPIRGILTTMHIKDSAFSCAGEMYLFTSVLAEFYALYATQNSFHQLEVKSTETNETYRWPAKRGQQPLL